MGNCFTCCDATSDVPSLNGVTGNISPNKNLAQSSSDPSLNTVSPRHTPMEKTHFLSSKETVTFDAPKTSNSHISISNGDRIMGTNYAKLPPIQSHVNDIKSTSSDGINEEKLLLLYEEYKDSDDDAITEEGIEKFCDDLEVDPQDFIVLVIAWTFNAEIMCRFTKSEFVDGCKKLKADSIPGIRDKFPQMLKELENKDNFKSLYRWTYKFGLDSENKRTLPMDMSVKLWALVFTQNEPRVLNRWISFLKNHPNIRGIPKDTWDMFLNFTESIGDDLSAYDENEAWPSLFDDFVEYENDCKNQNYTNEKMENGSIHDL